MQGNSVCSASVIFFDRHAQTAFSFDLEKLSVGELNESEAIAGEVRLSTGCLVGLAKFCTIGLLLDCLLGGCFHDLVFFVGSVALRGRVG